MRWIAGRVYTAVAAFDLPDGAAGIAATQPARAFAAIATFTVFAADPTKIRPRGNEYTASACARNRKASNQANQRYG